MNVAQVGYLYLRPRNLEFGHVGVCLELQNSLCLVDVHEGGFGVCRSVLEGGIPSLEGEVT